MFEVRQDAVIRPPLDAVWRLLTAFDDFPKWTSAVRCEGEARKGAPIVYVVFYRSSEGVTSSLRFESRITELTPEQRLDWRSGVPLLMDLKFGWRLSEIEQSLIFRQELVGRGPVATIGARKFQALVGSAFATFRRDLQRELQRELRGDRRAGPQPTTKMPLKRKHERSDRRDREA